MSDKIKPAKTELVRNKEDNVTVAITKFDGNWQTTLGTLPKDIAAYYWSREVFVPLLKKHGTGFTGDKAGHITNYDSPDSSEIVWECFLHKMIFGPRGLKKAHRVIDVDLEVTEFCQYRDSPDAAILMKVSGEATTDFLQFLAELFGPKNVSQASIWKAKQAEKWKAGSDPNPARTDLLTTEQACQLLGVKKNTIHSYVSRGVLSSVKCLKGQGNGRNRMYLRSEVEALRAGRKPGSTNPARSASSDSARLKDLEERMAKLEALEAERRRDAE